MIKLIIATGLSLVLFTSCNNNSKDSDDGDKPEMQKKISKRNLSITEANAYNDLFFDSTALMKYVADNKVPDSITRRLISFYNTRNYQYAWFSQDGLTEQARGFWNMHNYHTTYANDTLLRDKALQKKMDGLIAEEAVHVSNGNGDMLNTEIKLTEHFILYALTSIEDGYIKRKEMERFIPRMKLDPMYLADSLITKKHKDNKYYEDINSSYKGLKDALKQYYAIATKGGWPAIPESAAKLKKGANSPEVVDLKNRLAITGDMAADTIPVFDQNLEQGIRNFQARFGYTPTGTLTQRQVEDLNIPVDERIKQILVNMGRMQWMINEPKGEMILVNIPEFILHVKDGKEKVFDMNVVVGKEGHNTMMFTGDLNQIVFSPYWNIPSSIVKKEILPAMERNPGYLASHNMEMVNDNGGTPTIRQLPGAGNSLGKVKFLFPNSFDIYFHDTPAKSLFEKDKRAYSHGCIRLSEPEKMANYLLRNESNWPPEKINAAMNAGEEKWVKLDKAIPVLITYYTAWVDDNNQLHFADDIYDHDKQIMAKMFTTGAQRNTLAKK